MKKIILTLLLFTGFSVAYAQKTVPALKNGTNIYMTVYMQGQEIPVLLTLDKMEGPVSMKWVVDGFGEGSFDMTAAGVENGNSWFEGQPGQGPNALPDNQTFGIISKAAFKSLTDTKSFTYNGIKFTVKEGSPAIKFGDKEIDTIHAVTEDGKTAVWILNNPSLPLLIETIGLGMDLAVNDIK